MKIKCDFVTNSSSSSFVVMGSYIEIEDIPEDILNTVAARLQCDMDELKSDRYELMEGLLEGSDLEFSFGPSDYYDDEPPAVGMCYTKMNDEETLGEFKQKVKTQILKHFGIEIKNPGHIEMCWEDR